MHKSNSICELAFAYLQHGFVYFKILQECRPIGERGRLVFMSCIEDLFLVYSQKFPKRIETKIFG